MFTSLIGKIERVESRFDETEFKSYLDAFKFDCQVRNLTHKTLECYFERLGYLFAYLQEQDIPFAEVTKRVIQDYVMSLQGKVSDETVNGRIRVYRRFFNYLVEEGLWDSNNPMEGIKLLKTAKKVKPVLDPAMTQKIVNSLDKKCLKGTAIW